MSNAITNFEKMIAAGKDGALLRYGLGNEYFKAGDFGMATAHLQRAVALDRNYSAAWKLLGKALSELGQFAAALKAYEDGIEVADGQGDQQAAKEMRVFASRLRKQHDLG